MNVCLFNFNLNTGLEENELIFATEEHSTPIAKKHKMNNDRQTDKSDSGNT